MIAYAFANETASPLKKALHNPWCHLFWFPTGKSSRVHSSTQGLSHHVAGEVLGLLKLVANRRWLGDYIVTSHLYAFVG